MKIDYKRQPNLDAIVLFDYLPFPHTVTISKAKVGEEAGKIYITSGSLHVADPLYVERQAFAMGLAAKIARDFDYRWQVYTDFPDLLDQ